MKILIPRFEVILNIFVIVCSVIAIYSTYWSFAISNLTGERSKHLISIGLFLIILIYATYSLILQIRSKYCLAVRDEKLKQVVNINLKQKIIVGPLDNLEGSQICLCIRSIEHANYTEKKMKSFNLYHSPSANLADIEYRVILWGKDELLTPLKEVITVPSKEDSMSLRRDLFIPVIERYPQYYIEIYPLVSDNRILGQEDFYVQLLLSLTLALPFHGRKPFFNGSIVQGRIRLISNDSDWDCLEE